LQKKKTKENRKMDQANCFTRNRTCHSHQGNGNVFGQTTGPVDPSGRHVDISDRPLFCSSSNMRNEVVVGSSDHALYAIDVLDPRKRPTTMYSKTCGHTDWVTSVTHLADGQVLSAAMDGKLCLWSAQSRAQCIDLCRESTHPVSKVVSDVRYNSAISCGYDGNIEIWNLSDASDATAPSSKSRSTRPGGSSSMNSRVATAMRISPMAVLNGHADPVLECAYFNNFLASGDKTGSLMIWDLQRGQALHRFRAHPGPITAIECNQESRIVITSGTDGFVKVWDPRSGGTGLVHKIHVHVRDGSTNTRNDPRPTGTGGRGGRTTSSFTSSGGRTTGRTGTTTAGRTTGRASTSSIPSSRSTGPPPGPTSYPISVMSAIYSRGSMSDMNYIITGGGAAEDSRLFLLDIRNSFQPVVSWDHHRNGIYSLCVVGDNTVFSGDGVGTVLCHHLFSSDPYELQNDSRQGLAFGLGASEKGAVRSMQVIGNKLITCGEDGKVLIFDF
jgi:WD40 repeat protein